MYEMSCEFDMEYFGNVMDEDDTWFEIVKNLLLEIEVDIDFFKQEIDLNRLNINKTGKTPSISP